jgi:hypothetical protein
LEVGVEAGEAFVPAGHRSFPGGLVVSDREVDELTGGLVVGEVPADADGFADDAVEALDLVGNRYDIRASRACRRIVVLGSAGRVRGVVEESS